MQHAAFTATCAAPRSAVASVGRRNVCARSSPFFGSMVTPMRAQVAPPSQEKEQTKMIVSIVVGDSEPIESAIRRFKKDVTKSGHLYELRRRRYFETNTEKRLRKAAAAKRKARMARNMSNRARRNATRPAPATVAAAAEGAAKETTDNGPPTTATPPMARTSTRI